MKKALSLFFLLVTLAASSAGAGDWQICKDSCVASRQSCLQGCQHEPSCSEDCWYWYSYCLGGCPAGGGVVFDPNGWATPGLVAAIR
jgi:hypothetical protein